MPIALQSGKLLKTAAGQIFKNRSEWGPPTTVTSIGLNGNPNNGILVNSWRGRRIARLFSDGANPRFSLINDRNGTYKVSGGYLSFMGVDPGPIGTEHDIVVRVSNESGEQDVPLTYTVAPFQFNPVDVLEIWDYTDPDNMVIDGSNRVRKNTGLVHGCIREAPTGYGSPADSHAGVYSAGEGGVRFTAASQQYMRLAADAVNDPIRAHFQQANAPFFHYLIVKPKSASGTHALGGAVKADGTALLGHRMSAASGTPYGYFKGDDDTVANTVYAVPADWLVDQVEGFGAAFMGGDDGSAYLYQAAGAIDNPAPGQSTGFAVQASARGPMTTVADFYLGRLGSVYSDMVVLAEILLKVPCCPSKLRGFIDSNPAYGLSYEKPPLMPLDSVTPIYFDDFETFQLASTETMLNEPDQPWVFGLGAAKLDPVIGLYQQAANSTETALHVSETSEHYPPEANTLGHEEETVVRMSCRPISEMTLTPQLATFLSGPARLAREGSPFPYTHLGHAMCTRNSIAPMYGMMEVISFENAARSGVFPCALWAMANGGGHPPEPDVNESAGPKKETSLGAHEAPYWPYFPTRLAKSKVALFWAFKDEEYHSFQYYQDRATDDMVWGMDGYEIWRKPPTRGIRVTSAETQRLNWEAGIGGGEGVIATNGTQNGTLRLRCVGGGQTDVSRLFDVIVVVTNGVITGISGGTYQAQGCDAGNYVNGAALSFEALYFNPATNRNEWKAITCTVQPTCYFEVAENDPAFSRGFDEFLFMISNAAAGGYTGTLVGSYDVYVDAMAAYTITRAEPVITSPIQAAASAHCTALFAAMAAQNSGVGPDETDQNLLYNLVSGAMAYRGRWDVEQDGLEMPWNYATPYLWDMISQLGLFVGAADGFARVDIKDPANIFTVHGAPARSASGGYRFTSVSGQYVDMKKTMAAMAAATDMIRGYDAGLAMLLSEAPAATQTVLPAIGAGGSYYLSLGGANTAPGAFRPHLLLDESQTIASELNRRGLSKGFYFAGRREHRLHLSRNDERRKPFWSGYVNGRGVQHSLFDDPPAVSVKVGTNNPATAGPACRIGMTAVLPWMPDECSAKLYNLLLPYFQRHGYVPE